MRTAARERTMPEQVSPLTNVRTGAGRGIMGVQQRCERTGTKVKTYPRSGGGSAASGVRPPARIALALLLLCASIVPAVIPSSAHVAGLTTPTEPFFTPDDTLIYA